jgi:hypothetical protein
MGRLGTLVMVGMVIATGAALLLGRLFAPGGKSRPQPVRGAQPGPAAEPERETPVRTDAPPSQARSAVSGPLSGAEMAAEQSTETVDPLGAEDAATSPESRDGEDSRVAVEVQAEDATDSPEDREERAEPPDRSGTATTQPEVHRETKRVLAPPAPVPALKPVPAPRNFAALAENFSGLFTSLEMAARGEANHPDTLRILKSWERRIRESGDEEIVLEWQFLVARAFGRGAPPVAEIPNPSAAAARRLAREWLERLRSWGLQQERAGTLVLDDELAERYVIYDGGLQPGMEAHVIRGCWSIRGMVVEKGLVTAQA